MNLSSGIHGGETSVQNWRKKVLGVRHKAEV
jgi:hypothetical protein